MPLGPVLVCSIRGLWTVAALHQGTPGTPRQMTWLEDLPLASPAYCFASVIM